MAKSLTTFRDELLDRMLALLWSQWDALGVQGAVAGENNSIIDPEALILATACMGRYDARLFDEAMDWMRLHERLVNVARLQSFLKQETFSGGAVVRAMAMFLGDRAANAKWTRLIDKQPPHSERQSLFLLKDGRAMPVVGGPDSSFSKAGFLRDRVGLRHMSRFFDPDQPANLLLKLRGLFGVSSRAEVVAFLATHPYAGAAETAKQTAYTRRTVHNTLVELSLSGYLQTRSQGGENRYRLDEQQWQSILGHKALPWRNWGALFGALDLLWQKINSPGWQDADPLALASDMILFVRTLVERLERSGIDTGLRPPKWAEDADAVIHTCLLNLQRVVDLTWG